MCTLHTHCAQVARTLRAVAREGALLLHAGHTLVATAPTSLALSQPRIPGRNSSYSQPCRDRGNPIVTGLRAGAIVRAAAHAAALWRAHGRPPSAPSNPCRDTFCHVVTQGWKWAIALPIYPLHHIFSFYLL